MYELNSQNLDVMNAEVAYRHRGLDRRERQSRRELPRSRWWERRHHKSERAAA
jgi:hypothetical protein